MFYYTCPHCGASLSVALRWDSVFCPFCHGEIIFPGVAYVNRQDLLLWRLRLRHEEKPKKCTP